MTEHHRAWGDEVPRLRDLKRVRASDVAREAMRQVAERTGKRPEGITKVQPRDDSWTVEVEVVEERRVPSSADLLALYRLGFDRDGHLLSCRRVRRYPRGGTATARAP